jgi:hypothetical protein
MWKFFYTYVPNVMTMWNIIDMGYVRRMHWYKSMLSFYVLFLQKQITNELKNNKNMLTGGLLASDMFG